MDQYINPLTFLPVFSWILDPSYLVSSYFLSSTLLLLFFLYLLVTLFLLVLSSMLLQLPVVLSSSSLQTPLLFYFSLFSYICSHPQFSIIVYYKQRYFNYWMIFIVHCKLHDHQSFRPVLLSIINKEL